MHDEWKRYYADPTQENFTQLYERSARLIFSICLRILRDEEDAADAFQSVYTALCVLAGNAAASNAIPEFQPYLFRMTVREANRLRARRDRRRKHEVSGLEVLEMVDSAPPPDEAAAQRLLRAKIQALVAVLPDHYRLPLELHFFDGLTLQEIAEALDLPGGTVASRVSRGLKRLRPLMQRAGLSHAGAGLAVMTALGASVPASLSAAAVFSSAQAAIAVGATAAVIGTHGALLSKFSLGVLTMKLKVAAVSVAVLIGSSVVLLATLKKDETSVPVKAAASAALVIRETPRQDETLPAVASQAVVLASSQSKVEATPTATKNLTQATSETVNLQVRVVWKENRQPVENASVVLVRKSEPDTQDTIVRTNQKGEATLPCPSGQSRVWIEAHHPEGGDIGRFVKLASPGAQVFELPKGATLVGNVFFAATGAPAPGAEVWTVPAQGNNQGRRVRKVKTDAQGHFEIGCIGDPKVFVKARLDADISPLRPKEDKPIDIAMGQINGLITIRLEKGQSIHGIVRDVETKKPIAKALVKAGELQAETGADGAYKLEGFTLQQHSFQATAENYAKASADVVFSETGGAVQNFDLDPAQTVRVEVVDEKNVPIAEASVMAMNLTGNLAMSQEVGETNQRGILEVKGVSRLKPPMLSATKKGYQTYGGNLSQDSGSQQTVCRIQLPSLGQTLLCITGTVTNAEGKPIERAQVQWMRFEYPAPDLVSTDASGKYTIEAQYQISQADEVRIPLIFSARGYAPKRLQVVAGTKEKPRILDVMLEPGHWLEGRVLDEQGQPVKGAVIETMPADGVSYVVASAPRTGQSEARADAEGHFRLEDLGGPTCALMLKPPTQSSGLESLTVPDVKVDQSHEFKLQALGVIRGKVIDEQSRKPITGFQLSEYLGFPPTNFNSNEGRFEITKKSRESVTSLFIEADGYQPAMVMDVRATLPGDQQEVIVEMSKGKAIEGILIDAATGQPVASATVVHSYSLYRRDSMISWGSSNSSPEVDTRSLMREAYAKQAQTDANGKFSFEEGQPGNVYIQAKGYQPVAIQANQREEFQQGAKGLVVALKPGATVTCATAESELKDFSHIGLRLYRQPRKPAQAYGPYAEETAPFEHSFDGHMQLDGTVSWKDLPAGEYQLYYNRTNKLGSIQYTEDFQLAERGTAHLDLKTGMGPLQLKGRVLTPLNDPRPDTYLTLTPQFGWKGSFQLDLNNGNFLINGLKPGLYAVDAKRGIAAPQVRLATIDIKTNIEQDFVLPDGPGSSTEFDMGGGVKLRLSGGRGGGSGS